MNEEVLKRHISEYIGNGCQPSDIEFKASGSGHLMNTIITKPAGFKGEVVVVKNDWSRGTAAYNDLSDMLEDCASKSEIDELTDDMFCRLKNKYFEYSKQNMLYSVEEKIASTRILLLIVGLIGFLWTTLVMILVK